MDVLAGLAEQLGTTVEAMLAETHHIAHGTTSSLNALVTGNVPDVGFITTVGHRDSLFIMNVEGRYLGSAPDQLQNVLGQSKDHALLPKRHAVEVVERVDRDGTVLVPLDEGSVRTAVHALLADGIRSIAVSLLWSFRNPVHEQRVRELIREIDPDVFVALSSEISPRIREFARSATTVMSAQIGPGLEDYLGNLEGRLRESGLAGPAAGHAEQRRCHRRGRGTGHAISTIGSVLTGGVVGAVSLGEQLGHRNIISTDVGGTTFLVGLVVDGQPVRASTTVINHHPINVPTLKVHAIGSGGGAIAWIDQGGNLQVGPRSAQSVPGPACYGTGGTEPTNTDANLVLGILPEKGLLGGKKALDVEAAREAIRGADRGAVGSLRRGRRRRDLRRAERPDRRPAAQVRGRGRPRPAVVRALRLRRRGTGVLRVVRPRSRGRQRSSSRSARWRPRSRRTASRPPTSSWPPSSPTLLPMPLDPARAEQNFAALEAQVRDGLARQGLHLRARRAWSASLDMRYTMQLAEVARRGAGGTLDEPADRRDRRARSSGGTPSCSARAPASAAAGIQAITFRVRATGVLPFSPGLPKLADADRPGPVAGAARRAAGSASTRAQATSTPPSTTTARCGPVTGSPALPSIEVPTTTVVVPAGATGTVDHLGNLVIDTQREVEYA